MKLLILVLLLTGCAKKSDHKDSGEPILEEEGETDEGGNEGGGKDEGTFVLEIAANTIALGIEAADSALHLAGQPVAGPMVTINSKGEMSSPLEKFKGFDGLPIKVFFTGVSGDHLIIALENQYMVTKRMGCSLFRVPLEGGEMNCVDSEYAQFVGMPILQRGDDIYYYANSVHTSNISALSHLDKDGNVEILREEDMQTSGWTVSFSVLKDGSFLTERNDNTYRVNNKLINATEVMGVIGDTAYIKNDEPYQQFPNPSGGLYQSEVKTYSKGVYSSLIFEDPQYQFNSGVFVDIGDKGYFIDESSQVIKQITPTQLPAITIGENYKEYVPVGNRVFARSFSKIVSIDLTTGASTLVAEVEATAMSSSAAGDQLIVVTDDGILFVDAESLEVSEMATERKLANIKMIK
ncbi:MAG: hypothetical protein AB7T49_14660 [Oligoflexales bacterium]